MLPVTPSPDHVSILVADPDSLSRRALRDLLHDDPTFTVVGETGGNPTPLAHRLRPDLILVDPERGGKLDVGLLDALHKAAPDAELCVCTRVLTPEAYEGARRARARGYVLKVNADYAALPHLLVAVGRYHAVMAGPAVAEGLNALRAEIRVVTPKDAGEGLSKHERAVLELLVAGDTYAVIAEKTGIGKRTVGRIVERLCDRFGVPSAAALIAEATRRGIGAPGDSGH